ncbi:MAG TPA: hypothetical protein VFG30_28500 [Polyangiales bacterium]|nr:hypothetical protein [Polyangiales bacterium]
MTEGVRTTAAAARKRRRPTAGFVTVCVVYLAVAAFFAWGLATPDLDRVWTLHHELKSGRVGAPSERDRAVLIRSMKRHPELAEALLRESEIGLISSNMEGWIATSEATIVRTKRATAQELQLDIASPDTLLPITVELQGEGWREQRELATRGVHALSLPAFKGASELIVLRLKGRAAHADPSVLGVRVLFGEGHGAGS